MPFGLIVVLQVLLAIHAARTGRIQPWLYIIIFIPGIGCLLYLVLELGPELMAGRTGRRVASGVVQAVNPGRHYRALAREAEIAPTVHNRLRLAEECTRLGRAGEAATLLEGCLNGMYAADPAIRIALARARYASQDPAGAVEMLEVLARDTPDHRTPDGHLLYAMALEGAGRTGDALREYATLVDHYPGEEVRCRYAALLADTGSGDAARAQYQEVIRRVELQGGVYRRAQRGWYDAARRALAMQPPGVTARPG